MEHVHWWLAAVSFGLGMVLTLSQMARPSKTQMPAWVYTDPMSSIKAAPVAEPPPTIKPAEAPPKKIPAPESAPASKPASKRPATKAPPRKRRPVSADAATERIRVPRDGVAERIPGDRKRPAKKAATAKAKARAKGHPAKRIPASKDAVTQEISVGSEPATAVQPLIPYAPYGPGSFRANPDGSGPEEWTIKGRTDSRLFYRAEDPSYDEIVAQVWFETEEVATKAFFTPWSKSARTS